MDHHLRLTMATETTRAVCCICAVMKLKMTDAPGEMGRPVVIPESQKQLMKEKFKINQFNLMASDIISPNRSLSDIRMDA